MSPPSGSPPCDHANPHLYGYATSLTLAGKLYVLRECLRCGKREKAWVHPESWRAAVVPR